MKQRALFLMGKKNWILAKLPEKYIMSGELKEAKDTLFMAHEYMLQLGEELMS